MWFEGKLKLSCFGKLRIFSDFIEPVHGGGIEGVLRTWLLAASGLAERRVSDGQLPRMAYRVLVPEAGGRSVVAALLWPSADAVGRFFPFTVCSRVGRRRLALSSLEDLPLEVAPLWRRIQELAVAPNGDPLHLTRPDELTAPDVQRLIRAARITFRSEGTARAEFEAELRSRTAESYLETLLGKGFWVILPRVLWGVLAAARQLIEGGAGLAALRLPASEQLNSVEQAAFWLRLLGGVLGPARLARLPALILPVGQASETGVWIVFRDLLPQDFEALIGSSPGHDYLIDLRRPELPLLPEAGRAHFERFSAILQDRISGSSTALELAELPLTEIAAAAAQEAGVAI